MRKILVILLLFFAQISCAEEKIPEPDTKCAFSKDFITTYKISDADISNYHWEGRESETSEYIQTLYLTYKNGDMAVIEHKYCMMYNFTVNLFVADKVISDPPSQEQISQKLTKIFQDHFKHKVTFKPKLSEVILTNLKTAPRAWHDYQYFMEENSGLELYVNEKSIGSESMVFSKFYSLYVGVGSQ